MTTPVSWQCPTCKDQVATAFCPRCGECPIPPLDLTLRGVFRRLLHAFTSVDGRVARTFWRLLRHPGTLTVAYMEGVRKPHASPVQVFLLANVLFFAVQSFTGTSIFGSSLESHLHQQDWSALAQSLLDRRLAATQQSVEHYAPVFDRANMINAKSLVILMTVPFAGVLALAFLSRRQPFLGHMVFALHFYAFALLLFSLAVLAAGIHQWLGGAGLMSPQVDNVLSAINVVACTAYLYAATGPAYAARGPVRFIKALALAIAVGAIVLGYRFVLFLITLYVG